MARPPRPANQPWRPAQAAERIRWIAQDDATELSYKQHAIEQLRTRNLLMGDVLHVLKTGFVYENPQKASRDGFWKYKIENKSPNSRSREIRVVVIPSVKPQILKIITVMWIDER